MSPSYFSYIFLIVIFLLLVVGYYAWRATRDARLPSRTLMLLRAAYILAWVSAAILLVLVAVMTFTVKSYDSWWGTGLMGIAFVVGIITTGLLYLSIPLESEFVPLGILTASNEIMMALFFSGLSVLTIGTILVTHFLSVHRKGSCPIEDSGCYEEFSATAYARPPSYEEARVTAPFRGSCPVDVHRRSRQVVIENNRESVLPRTREKLVIVT